MQTIKLLTVIEASTITGPAKLFLDFCRQVRAHACESDDLPKVSASVVTFSRGRSPHKLPRRASLLSSEAPRSEFVAAAHRCGIEVDLLHEACPFDPRVIRRLKGVVQQRAPDIVETQAVKSHFLMRLSGLYHDYPWVALHHGYTTTDLKMRAYNQLDRWSLPRADRVVTVCSAFASQLTRIGVSPEQIRVLHSAIRPGWENPVSGESSSALKARLGLDPEAHVLLAVGRLSREKGHADLVLTLDYLRRLRPGMPVSLIIVGDGPERRRVTLMAAALGLERHMLFAGQVDEVQPFYSLADVLVLPSHSEGSPNVLLEGMMARVPIVATAVGGVPEMVRDSESALLVKPRNPRAMAEAISRLLVDKSLAQQLASKAHSSVLLRHSQESRLRSLVEIYCQMLRRHS
jgi:glycosyltransferase involved in cell wall biosynthesis